MKRIMLVALLAAVLMPLKAQDYTITAGGIVTEITF